MGNRTQRLLLWCAATDSTFELARVGDRTVLAGKCIHCKSKLAIALDGTPLANETVEHIIPRTHGGTDAVANLAIACARCNQGKGRRLDARRWEDETLQRVISTLQARRAERMRAPLEGICERQGWGMTSEGSSSHGRSQRTELDLPAQPGPGDDGSDPERGGKTRRRRTR